MFGLTDIAKVPLQMRNPEQAITFIASWSAIAWSTAYREASGPRISPNLQRLV